MYLVTGGAGFIGSHIVERLVSMGHGVRVLDNFSSGTRDNLRGLEEKVDLVCGDILDPKTVRQAMAGVEVVFHQAAPRSGAFSFEDTFLVKRVNKEGTLHVLAAARDAKVRRVVYASSSSVYRNNEALPQRESQVPSPMLPDAVSKLTGEHYCKVFTELYGLETVSLRYFDVFGPRQDPNSPYAEVIPRFIRRALRGEPLEVHGDGLQSRDFTYIDNVVDANWLAAHSSEGGGGVFNIGQNRAYTLRDLIEVLRRIFGKDLSWFHTETRPGDVRHTLADISRAGRVLGYRPKVSIEDGIARTVGYFTGIMEMARPEPGREDTLTLFGDLPPPKSGNAPLIFPAGSVYNISGKGGLSVRSETDETLPQGDFVEVPRPLRVLVVEDSEDDTSLLIRELRQANYEPTFERVDSPGALAAALSVQTWDLIISDFTMPHFSGTDALEIVKKSGLDIPFVFLSGTLGEDAAVAAMKAGAQDYVMKGNTRRLIPAIEREVGEAEVRRERKKAEEQIGRQQEQMRALHEINLAITSTLDLQSVLELLTSKMELVLPYPVWTTVRLLNRETGKLEPIARANVDESEHGGNGWRAGRGLSQLVFETRAPLVLHNVQLNPGVLDHEYFRKHGLVSYLGVPLIVKDEVLGVLGIYTKEEHEFSSQEIEFLSTLANQVAIAIHNSRLYEQTKRQAAELEKANTAKSEFLSVVSHELRTPLTAIVGYADVIRKGLVGSTSRKHETAAGRILSCSNELMTMTNSILEAQRLEVGEIEVENHEVHLGSFLADLRSIYEVPLNKEVRLGWSYSRHLPVIRADGNKLRHILQNLINNAIKFTDKGSVVISVRYLPVAKAVRFQVSDTGIGIPRKSLPKIFEMFRQLPSSQTRSHGGVGLGLHIVKKFTELLKGKIEVESELGKGSTFTVTLPCKIVRFP